MKENTAKRILKADGVVLAVTVNFVHSGLAEYLGRLGYNPLVLDAEHGGLTDKDVEEFLRACDVVGVTPIMRLPFNSNSEVLMQRYLDMGIHGFHIPHLVSADQARAVVRAVKYRPIGNRGVGTSRSTDWGATLGDWTTFSEKANAETLIKVSLEDADGFAALPELVKIPEIDVISFGQNDLADSMGLPGQRLHPKVIEIVDKAIAQIRAAGKAPGGTMLGPNDLATHYRRGARYLTTSVSKLLAHGSGDYIGELKKLQKG